MEDALRTVESAAPQASKDNIDKKSPTSRPRPISLKVPVAVQGSQESADSEDFREETNTIIVFNHGAVVRLAASVSVGQLVVLTNRKSDQEALCTVVKVKSEPSTKDYVELQFSHPAADFWESPEHKLPHTELSRSDEPYYRPNTSQLQAMPTPVPNVTSALAEALAAASDAQNVAEQQIVHSENHPDSSVSSITGTAAVPENSAPLQTPEIRGFGFWDGSFPQEILSSAEASTSTQTEAPPSTAQEPRSPENQRLNPTQTAQHRRKALQAQRARSEVIEFRKEQKSEHFLVRADLVAKTKVAIAGVGLAAILAIVGVAMHSHHAANTVATLPPVAHAPAPANTTQPEISVPETTRAVRGRVRANSAPPPPEARHATSDSSSRVPAATKKAPLQPANPKPAIASQPEPAAIGQPATQVAATTDQLPLDLNPKSDNPAPAPRNLSMPLPAATPAIKLGGNAQEARLISSVPPVYPALAKSLGIEGTVMVHGVIEASGQVTHMSVVSGPSVLRNAAMDAIGKWKYAPGMLDGKPAATEVNITVDFHVR